MTEEVKMNPEEVAYRESLYEYVKTNQPLTLHDFGFLNGYHVAYDATNKPYFWNSQVGYWFPDWRVQELVAKVSKAA